MTAMITSYSSGIPTGTLVESIGGGLRALATSKERVMTEILAPVYGRCRESGDTVVFFLNGLTRLCGVGVWKDGEVVFAKYFPTYDLALADFLDQWFG